MLQALVSGSSARYFRWHPSSGQVHPNFPHGPCIPCPNCFSSPSSRHSIRQHVISAFFLFPVFHFRHGPVSPKFWIFLCGLTALTAFALHKQHMQPQPRHTRRIDNKILIQMENAVQPCTWHVHSMHTLLANPLPHLPTTPSRLPFPSVADSLWRIPRGGRAQATGVCLPRPGTPGTPGIQPTPSSR